MSGPDSDLVLALLRYVSVGATLVAIVFTLRFGRVSVPLGLTLCLGLSTWIATWAPLERPYGVAAGSAATFELAVVATSVAGEDPLTGWVSGGRSPRPAWSAMWRGLSPLGVRTGVRLYAFSGALLVLLVPLTTYFVLWRCCRESRWEWSVAAFAVTLVSSVPLDAFRPFGLLFPSFYFESPHRALGLTLLLVAFGLAWRATLRRGIASGALLGLVGWIDLTLFAWGGLALLGWPLLARLRGIHAGAAWIAAAVGFLLAAPQLLFYFVGALLTRAPSSAEVLSYRVILQDVFAATTDMEWVFVLMVMGLVWLWRRGRACDLGILSLVASAYVLWIGTAIACHLYSLSGPGAVFHLIRVSAALAAGSGGFLAASWIVRRLEGRLEPRLWKRLSRSGKEPVAVAMALSVLLPYSISFIWNPLKMDPGYYTSLRPFDPDTLELLRWLERNAAPEAIVVTSSETAEMVAALAGRRVVMAERAPAGEAARRRRRAIRRLVGGEPRLARAALEELEADLLILDRAFRWEFREPDRDALVASGLFDRVGRLGGTYTIYRATAEAVPVRGLTSGWRQNDVTPPPARARPRPQRRVP